MCTDPCILFVGYAHYEESVDGLGGSSIQQTTKQVLTGEQGGIRFSSTVTEQTATEGTQEKISSSSEIVQTTTKAAETHDSSSKEFVQTSIQQISTPMETTVQLAIAESEQLESEQSMDNVSSSTQKVSSSTRQEAVLETMVKAVGIDERSLEATIASSGATGVKIHSGKNVQDSTQKLNNHLPI